MNRINKSKKRLIFIKKKFTGEEKGKDDNGKKMEDKKKGRNDNGK